MKNTQVKNEMENSVDIVKSFFGEGAIQEKLLLADVILSENHALFFDGEIKWSVTLSEFDRVMKGQSETLEAGLLDIKSCLLLLGKDYGEDNRVCIDVSVFHESAGV